MQENPGKNKVFLSEGAKNPLNYTWFFQNVEKHKVFCFEGGQRTRTRGLSEPFLGKNV